MFGRKPGVGEEGGGVSEALPDSGSSAGALRRMGNLTDAPASSGPSMPHEAAPQGSWRPAVTPQRPVDGNVPGIKPSRPREVETRRLIVGQDISLTGKITACEKLVVEGNVNANLDNCHEIQITQTGLFKGNAPIENAEIHGRFEGTLTVRKRLLIGATGRVTGTVRYGRIEIATGGEISGNIQSQPAAEEAEVRPPGTVIPMPADGSAGAAQPRSAEGDNWHPPLRTA